YYYSDREQSTNTGEKFAWSECQLHYHFHYLPIISSEAGEKTCSGFVTVQMQYRVVHFLNATQLWRISVT
ncbi:MAG: hypothetical protein LGB66_06530, partial [Sulfurovum sp.]|nr:hypothetical protein [Sulfurovum sp.]